MGKLKFWTTVNFEVEYVLNEETEGVLTDTVIYFYDQHLTWLYLFEERLLTWTGLQVTGRGGRWWQGRLSGLAVLAASAIVAGRLRQVQRHLAAA